jgi:hypothetical protein
MRFSPLRQFSLSLPFAAMPQQFPEFIDPVDDCEWMPARQIFERLGYVPIPPDKLDDFQVRGSLWEMIYALAARRFYLSNTEHLNDRQLYTWLHDHWFNEQHADTPPEAEWNCRIDVSETGNEDSSIWLRYYADEKIRQNWLADFPDTVLPPRETPPFDRDRFLPEPPIASKMHSEGRPGDPLPGELDEAEDDPLGLAQADWEIAASIEQSKFPDTPPDEFEQQLNAMEPESWTPPVEQLRRDKIPLLPPDELTDDTLTPALWELLHNLACQGFYVLSTNHLSDREIYAELWQRGLRDSAYLPGRDARGGWFHDFLGSGSDEHVQMLLRYYYDDAKRDQLHREWNVPLPTKERAPFNRDWRLPKGPFG